MKETSMSKFSSNLAKSLVPYVPGEQPKDKKYIKLNTNENPYGPSPEVDKAMELEISKLNLYPDPEVGQLKQALSECYKIGTDSIFVSNGSDEVLAFIFPSFFTGKKISFPSITYSFYTSYAGLFSAEYEKIPLTNEFGIDVKAYNLKTEGIIIPNPNAPTGKILSKGDIKTLLENNRETLVVIDEAYIDFGGESVVDLVPMYDNLLVTQTFSKSRSLAGLRIGYCFGNPALIKTLETVKNSFNSYTVNRLASVAAIASLKDSFYFEKTRMEIMETRENTRVDLENLGFKVLDSKANFLFACHKQVSGATLFSELKEKGVLVRHFSQPEITNYLRISIGTPAEMKGFIQALNEILKEMKA